MADVPVVQNGAAGLPPLIRGVSIQLPTLVFSDIFTGFGSQGAPQWGIFLNGQPVVVFDTFINFQFKKGWDDADYPVERGQFETYNKVNLPYDARCRFAAGGTLSERAALIASCQAIAPTLQRYDVVTPEAVYTSANVVHIDYSRAREDGAYLILFDVWLREVIVSSGSAQATGAANATQGNATDASSASPFETGAPPLNNTFDPSGASSIPGGLVQPQVPTSGQQAVFDTGVGSAGNNRAAGGGGGGGF